MANSDPDTCPVPTAELRSNGLQDRAERAIATPGRPDWFAPHVSERNRDNRGRKAVELAWRRLEPHRMSWSRAQVGRSGEGRKPWYPTPPVPGLLPVPLSPADPVTVAIHPAPR